MAKSKTTLKITDEVYHELQKVRVENKRCKYNDDTIRMLIRFYRLHKGRV